MVAEGGELLRATSRSIIMHFYYYTICINVLETSTKTNCSSVQREEHSNVCKTLQAAIGERLPLTALGFSDLSWHKRQRSPAPSAPSSTALPAAHGCQCTGKGSPPAPSLVQGSGLACWRHQHLLASLTAFVSPSEGSATVPRVHCTHRRESLCSPSVGTMLTETQIHFALMLIVQVTKGPMGKTAQQQICWNRS